MMPTVRRATSHLVIDRWGQIREIFTSYGPIASWARAARRRLPRWPGAVSNGSAAALPEARALTRRAGGVSITGIPPSGADLWMLALTLPPWRGPMLRI